METLAALARRLETTNDLGDIVRTMKTMAAASIRQYELAVESLEGYAETVRNGLQAALREQPGTVARSAPRRRLGAIVFGSDQGMCGPLNEQVTTFALESVRRLKVEPRNRFFLAVGTRAAFGLEASGERLQGVRALPGSIDGITSAVGELLDEVRQWEIEGLADHVILIHSRPRRGGAASRPHAVGLVPLDRRWLEDLGEKRWAGPSLPMLLSPPSRLVSGLVQHYLFIMVYRAFAESLASEQASRLNAMRAAEKNIDERLHDLTARYREERQAAITTELLDIVTGFDALEGSGRTT